MTQCKALLDARRHRRGGRAAPGRRAGRALRRLVALGEPRGRRRWSSASSSTRTEDPERPPRPPRRRSPPRARSSSRRCIVVRQAEGLGPFAAAPHRRAARASSTRPLEPLLEREEIAEAYRATEGGQIAMTRYRHLITDDNRKWWTLGAMCFALFMIMLDNTVVNVALPSIQRDLAPRVSRPRVDDQRLHALLRGAAGHRRAARRHLRPPPHVPRRRRHLRRSPRRPPASRQNSTDLVAQPRRPGGRRGADDAGDALDRHQRLRARTSAARRSAPGPASRRWRSRSARWSAACSPSTSPGGRSSTSTSRSRSARSPRRSSRSASRATRRVGRRSTTSASAP